MADFVFKLGTLDLSSYCRMNPDDKFDPYSPHFVEPSFAETPFADTQVLVSTTVNNREMQIPLFLVDITRGKDQLHALIIAVNNASAQRPLTVEWRDAGASASTFSDVVFCRFEPDFNFRRSVHGYAAGILHLYVAGYGHTGTTRVAATAAGTGIFLSVPIPSVAGDAPALLHTTINAGAVVPSLGRIVAVAPIQNPSYVARIPAASLTDRVAGATLTGLAGADGSQYLGLPIALTGGASGVACKVPLPNPTIAGGDNRILAVVIGAVGGGVGINAVDPYGNAMGPTAVASNSQGWGLVDLGVCRLPTIGYPTQPKISILAGAVWASGAATPGAFASPNTLLVNEVFCLPDKNLTLLLESKAAGSVVSRDGFGRYGALNGTNDGIGNPWGGVFSLVGSPAGQAHAGLSTNSGYLYTAGATGTFDSRDLRSILTDSMLISAKALSQGSSLGEVRLIKDVAASQWVEAKLSYPGNYLTLTTSGTNRASVALASVNLQLLRLSLQVAGGRGLVNLSRDDGGALLVAGASSAYASLGASNAAIAGGGAPGVAIGLGPQRFDLTSFNPADPQVSSWEVDTIPSSNLLPYDSYRIDGVNADSYRRSSAGVFSGQKLVSAQRGAFAKVQPSTSSIAVICAPFDQGVANDLISAVVSVRERFSYAR